MRTLPRHSQSLFEYVHISDNTIPRLDRFSNSFGMLPFSSLPSRTMYSGKNSNAKQDSRYFIVFQKEKNNQKKRRRGPFCESGIQRWLVAIFGEFRFEVEVVVALIEQTLYKVPIPSLVAMRHTHFARGREHCRFSFIGSGVKLHWGHDVKIPQRKLSFFFHRFQR